MTATSAVRKVVAWEVGRTGYMVKVKARRKLLKGRKKVL
jgi:hypothetical protein